MSTSHAQRPRSENSPKSRVLAMPPRITLNFESFQLLIKSAASIASLSHTRPATAEPAQFLTMLAATNHPTFYHIACLNTGCSTRIKDAGIAIRHSQGYIISILQGLEMGWRGLDQGFPSQEISKMDQFGSTIIETAVSPKS